jgi:hypothetical protein
MLVERDDSDWIQASRLRVLTSAERTARFDRFLAQARAFRGSHAA